MHKKKSKYSRLSIGFTLIELLVVISIIGLLASVVMLSLNAARTKSRDAKRVADLNNIAKALELYYADNQKYLLCNDPSYPVSPGYSDGCDFTDPISGGRVDSSLDGKFVDFLVPKYISKDPIDPSNTLSTGYFYAYGSGQYPPGSGHYYSYALGVKLENPNDPALKNSILYGNPSYAGYYVIGMPQ